MSQKKLPIPTNRLKVLREAQKLTQAEVAKLADIDVTTYCKHEGCSRGLEPTMIKKYAQIFKCDSYEIFHAPFAEAAE